MAYRAGMDWWVDLLQSGAVGFLLALVLAAFAVLVVANAIIWPIAWLKAAVTKR